MKQFFTVILYRPLYNILIFFAWLVPGHTIGMAIVLLTLIIRFALLPLSLKGARAQVKLQALQPKINKLRAEVKDQQEQGKALMALYKKEGVSPFGSCLIALIQLPILIILYRVFRAGLDINSLHMLYSFMPRPENISNMFLGVNLLGKDAFVLPILAGGTQMILSYLMQPQKPKGSILNANDPMSAMNKQMMYLLPLMTFIFARSVPAALVIYWIVTTIFSIAQQVYINVNIKKELEVAEEEIEEVDLLAGQPIEEVVEAEVEVPKKKDFMTKMMDNRLAKQEKKSGVEVTIRKKK